MRLEGLLVGGSSGSALSGALRWLKTEEGKKIATTKGANVVVLLPDGYAQSSIFVLYQRIDVYLSSSIRNYMSKPWFLNMALESEPSALARRIADVLNPSSSVVVSDATPDALAQGLAAPSEPIQSA